MSKNKNKRPKTPLAMQVFITISVTLIMLLLIEIGVFVLTEISYKRASSNDIDYGYDNEYLNNVKELRSGLEKEYCEFLDHCTKEIHSGDFNVDFTGERRTINSCANGKDDIIIYLFGGSTTFCAEVLDQDTWASVLSKNLCDNGHNVKIYNFGESGYVSDQEVIRLILELKNENREKPDYVVFFDGSNDYYSAYQNKKPGMGQNLFNREMAFKIFTKRNLFNPVFVSSTFKALRFMASKQDIKYTNEEIVNLSNDIKGRYIQNAKQVAALAKEYEFTPIFIWQPTVFTKGQLSEYEKNNIHKYKHGKLLEVGDYENTIELKRSINNFYDFTGIFNSSNGTIFLDHVHVGRVGNKIIAKNMADVFEHVGVSK